MYKDTQNFLSKFGGRVEMMGKDGFIGIVRQTGTKQPEYNFNMHKSIVNNEFSKNNNIIKSCSNKKKVKLIDWQHPSETFLKKKEEENRQSNFNYFDLQDSIPINKSNKDIKIQRSYSTNNDSIDVKKRPLLYSVNFKNKNKKINDNDEQKNEHHIIGNNCQEVFLNGYRPYTINDYRKMPKNIILGKLGPNLGTKEWNEKKNRMQKMSEYGVRVMHDITGCYKKLSESAEQQHKQILEEKNINGKWNKINEYSRGLLFSQERENSNKFKKGINEMLLIEDEKEKRNIERERLYKEHQFEEKQKLKNFAYYERLYKMKDVLLK